MQIDSTYADLLNDDVFKLVFGQESTKDVMIEFLNRVISERTIVDVEYMPSNTSPSRSSALLRNLGSSMNIYVTLSVSIL